MDCSVAPELTTAARTTIVCLTQPATDWRAFLGPALILVSAFIAWRALLNTRSVARQRATLDLVEKKESTEYYRAISRQFFDLRAGPGFMHLVDPANAADKAARRSLFDYLNHYELVSIGIRQNILDEKIYRSWMEGAFVRDWNAAADFVQRQRWKRNADGSWQYRASIYANYQFVARRWSKDARMLTRESSPPPIVAAGPGDEALPEPIDDVALDKQ